jgi:hypothetical protein
MKSRFLFALLLFVLPLNAQTPAPATKEDAKQTHDAPALQTKKELLDYLNSTRKNLENSVKGLSEAQLRFKPAPDKWSVAEVSEHIALSEGVLGGMITDKVMTSPAAEKKLAGKEEQIVSRITDRSQKAQAPDMLKPTGKWPTEAETLKAFNEMRDKNAAFVSKTSMEDLRSHIMAGPGGEMDAFQWMLFTAAHSARHTKQIEEVKADPNFPKK